jgi:hypothetical protein
VIAYKLLRPGRVGPFSRVVWPPPGEWLEAERVDPCHAGVHACRAEDLPFWIGLGELWEVELDEHDAAELPRKVVAHRGRLVRRVEAWDDEARSGFVRACSEHARALALEAPELTPFAEDIKPTATPQGAGYVAARMAEVHGGPSAYDAERRRQAEWLIDALGLARGAGMPAQS